MLTRYCGDHFTVNTNIESLCCIPETNIILCQLYLNFLKSLGKLYPYVGIFCSQ